jgi:hypothetical protein
MNIQILMKYHMTELLTGLSGTLAALAVGGVVTPETAVMINVVVAVLGVWRGVFESVAKEHRTP